MSDTPKSENTIHSMMDRLPRPGKVIWIGLRPERKAPLKEVETALALENRGFEGDRATQKSSVSKRQITLIMAEHLKAVARILGREEVDPGLIRRNIVTEGINLMALKDRKFRIGEAVLELTGPCHPCSRMEANLGFGGYNAMRGHGGWCAIVLEGGEIQIGDEIAFTD